MRRERRGAPSCRAWVLCGLEEGHAAAPARASASVSVRVHLAWRGVLTRRACASAASMRAAGVLLVVLLESRAVYAHDNYSLGDVWSLHGWALLLC